MYIAFSAGTTVATASIVAEFHGDIEPYFETAFSSPLQGEYNEGLQGHSFSLE